MCGFVGGNFSSKATALDMLKSIQHRGPDASSVFRNDDFTLAHCLLSIRGDVDESVQPFREDGCPWVLLFNGQIYNTRNLVKKFNIPSSSELDTKILFELIKLKGEKFIDELSGMFAIALYNTDTKILNLYRDPSGQKPLYYLTDNNNYFYFSSEINGFSSLKNISDRFNIDSNSIYNFLCLGYLPFGCTQFRNISKVLPGENLRIEFSERGFKIHRSFFKSISNAFDINDTQSVPDMLKTLMRFHSLGKYKAALNLSGGLDSTSILAVLSSLGIEVKPCTTYFEDAPIHYNEEFFLAKDFCKLIGITHEKISIRKEDFIDNFYRAYFDSDHLNGNVAIPLYFLVAKYHKSMNNTVVLTGDGGDEVWGGYNHHLKSFATDQSLLSYLNPRSFFNRGNFKLNNFGERYLYYRSSLPEYKNYNPQDLAKFFIKSRAFKYINRNYEWSNTKKMMRLEQITWLAEENFARNDTLYMSFGIESRSPFALEDFRIKIFELFSDNAMFSKNINKPLLRHNLQTILPPTILSRIEKRGWHAPLQESWYNSELKSIFLDIIPPYDDELVNWKTIRDAISSNSSYPGKVAHRYFSLATQLNKYK